MDIFYENHLGDRIDLDSENIILQYQELFDYSWDADTINGRISSFYRESATIPVSVTVTADTAEEYDNILNNFHGIVSKDVLNVLPGKLYLGDQYLVCYISGDIKDDAFMGVPIQVKNLTVVTDVPYWITEEKRSFQKIDALSASDTNLDYTFDHAYDYTMLYGGDVIWQVDHFAPCEYEMIIYGPCVDPRVVINGHVYQVYTILDENDYIKINSRKNSVIQYMSNGVQKDMYDFRAKATGSIFDPITPGNIRVVWSGEFGFDLTLFCERSEPKWKTQDS